MSHSRKHTGFTLLETLLALFITAILIAILSFVFNTGLRSYRQGNDLLEITRKGQLILGQMTRELISAMVGPKIIFQGEANAVFFMAPIAIEDEKLDLCEVGYLHDDKEKEVIRHYLTYWNDEENKKNENFEYPEGEVDYGGKKDEERKTFCTDVTSFKLRYHDGNKWLAPQSKWSDSSKLPVMVEVTVTIQGEYPKDAPKQKKTFTTWIYLPNSTDNP